MKNLISSFVNLVGSILLVVLLAFTFYIVAKALGIHIMNTTAFAKAVEVCQILTR